MLDTLELMERLTNIKPQVGGTPDDRKHYQTVVDALFQQWQRYLADRYAQGFTANQQQAIYDTALRDGEARGEPYLMIEQLYERYTSFARNFLPGT